MRRLAIILFCVCYTLVSHSQDLPARWTATFTPALIPLPSGGQFGLQPGVEFMISEKLGLLLEFTFQTGKSQHADSAALNKKYFRIKPEIRYYLSNEQEKLTKYAGLQLSYSFRGFKNEKQGFYNDDPYHPDQSFYFEEAYINTPITTVSFQFGVIFSDGKKFGADVFAGFGRRFVNTSFRDVVNLTPGPRFSPPPWFNAEASYQRIGWESELHLNAGVRFLYRFYNKR
jgi:hypothetical protein